MPSEGKADTDRDSLSNRYEARISHTNPRRADTDRDGLSDGFEVRRSKTSPLRKDTDRDGLSDRYEVRRSKTSPLRKDTDRDGVADGVEVMFGRDPLSAPAPGPRGFEPSPAPLPAPAPATPADVSTPPVDDDAPTPPPVEPPRPAMPPSDLTAPQTTITSGPSGTETIDSASFSFNSSESESTFECRLDAGSYKACVSGRDYTGLANGSHTFRVRATDAAGNTDPSPATRTWTVDASTPEPPPPADTTAPDTTIGSGPSGTVASDSTNFTFSASEDGSTFECRLDGSAWKACASPRPYAGLANGSHTFDVRATDAADNTDASPASRTWTVDVPIAPPSGSCDRDATTSTFAAQVSAASAGQVICLAAGSYGTWTGTNKAITIRPQDGASPTMGIRFASGASGFTIDGGRTSFSSTTGLTINGAGSPAIGAGAANITIKNTTFTVGLTIDGVTNSNIVFDHNQHANLSADNYTGAFHLSYRASQHSGVTIQNSLLRDMSSDGIQAGPAVNILNNEFARIAPAVSSQHTDAIQLYCGCGTNVGSTVRGNYIHEGEQAIGVFDGTNDNLIEHNVVQNFSAHWITLMADTPASTIQFNTVTGSGGAMIACYSKPGATPSKTIIRNNIANSIGLSGSTPCSPTANANNMVRSGGGGSNFAGTPVYVGGANPTTFSGFQLSGSSPGKGKASDGTDVGAFGGGFTGGPPAS